MEHNNIKLYRKRLIPNELVLLSSDKIIENTSSYIITSWNTLKPRKDFSYGYSAYFFSDGIKVSKMYKSDDSFVYYYCDIISYTFNKAQNTYICEDLLVDVIVMPDGFVKVIDLDEVAQALMGGIIAPISASEALCKANTLLSKIYSGNFNEYTDILNKAIEKNSI